MSKEIIWKKIFKALVYVLPAVLFLAAWPVIDFGSTGYMNLELFLPLIWLVVFDVVGFIKLFDKQARKNLMATLKNKKIFLVLAFPIFMTISIIWSKDVLRGILTCGIVWAILIAGLAFYQTTRMWPREEFAVLKRRLVKIFLLAAVGASAVCLVQCILDIMGVGHETTLLCAGCGYEILGFTHPNGLAAEPQYMGNLLLAPIGVAIYMVLAGKTIFAKKKNMMIVVTVFLVMTLFLTLSRGAIFSFAVMFVVLMGYAIYKKLWRKLLVVLGTTVMAFGVALSFQGVMAEIAPTTDTFWSGVTKSIHQLSLGKIDLRFLSGGENEVIEEINEGENEGGDVSEDGSGEDLVEVRFDGYIEVSTGERVKFNNAAVGIWTKDAKNLWLGVGAGGASRSLFEFDNAIVGQVVLNVYLTVLVETGLVGASLALVAIVYLLIRISKLKSADKILLLAILVAYGVSINFFSGIGNSVHVYLVPMVIYAVVEKDVKDKP